MLKVTCVRSIKYNNSYIKAGTEFEIPDSELSYMLTVGATPIEHIPDEPTPLEVIITSDKDLDEYKRAELIDMAKAEDIPVPYNVSKQKLIEIIKEKRGVTNEFSTDNVQYHSCPDGEIQEDNLDS